jgi:DNA-binding transcriptional MerR regulator
MSPNDARASKPLSTSGLARAAAVHPNTVRRYEALGWIPPAPRAANGYRRFGQRHLDCLRLARLIVARPYPSLAMRHAAMRVIPPAVADAWNAALERAKSYRGLVQDERAHAESAAAQLQDWANSAIASAPDPPARIGQAARLLGVSIDVLRNWERNGLISVPRSPENRYRAYTPADIIRLRVIRLLSRAGYSQMAMLRMLLRLESGDAADLRAALDTPAPDEDVYTAADRWLSALAAEEAAARRLVAYVEEVIGVLPPGRHSRPPNPPVGPPGF